MPIGSPRLTRGDAATAADRQFVGALAKGLNILDCFSPACTSLGVTEIAGLLGMPQQTAWRLCHTLTTLGYLERDDGDRLRPALAVLRLGYSALSDLSAPALARPHLQELASAFRGAAGVAVPDGGDMRFVERCEGKSQLLMNLRVGSRVPIVSSALGWAYLAGIPETDRQAAFATAPLDRKSLRATEAAFRRALTGYRTDGFIVNDGVFHPGYTTAAVPVLGPDGRPLMALNCGGAISILSTAQLRHEVGPKLRGLAAMLATIV